MALPHTKYVILGNDLIQFPIHEMGIRPTT